MSRPAAVERILFARSLVTDEFAKHYGPGPHPGTNTPQSIHGVKTGSRTPVTATDLDFPTDYALRRWKRAVNDSGMSEQWLRDGQAWLDATNIPDRSIFIRMPPSVLEAVIIDGRFKTQFETNYSSGSLAPMKRSQAEMFGFNYSHDLDPALRPVYGYLNDEHGYLPNANEDDPGLTLAMYGRAAIKLKDEVKVRTTWTMNDSLGDLLEVRVAPTLMLKPGLSSINPLMLDVAGYNAKHAEELNLINREAVGNKPLSPMDVDHNYVEAQIHGGVSVSDIDYVILPSDNLTSAARRLSERGIEVRVHDVYTDEIAPWQAP